MEKYPTPKKWARIRNGAALAALIPALSSCHAVVLDPSGDVASQLGDMVLVASALMLLIIVPVMALTVLFARKYRASNTEAVYEPEWEHSTQLELIIWAAPLLIIIALGAVTWTGTHKLDPYHPIDRLAAGKPVPAGVEPLEVQVVALDWKWLFIYPQYGIATVNDLAAPVDRPIRFHLTASSVMNDFYVPALAGQIYAMPSMETQLNAVINKPGDYKGFNANYSGEGFNYMKFTFHGLDDAQFDQWIAKAKQSGTQLDRSAYLQLAKPSKAVPVTYYAAVAPHLYQLALNNCVAPGSRCIVDDMRKDMETASGKAGHEMAMDMHKPAPAAHLAMGASTTEPLRGAGLTPPDLMPGGGAMLAEADQSPQSPSSL